MKVENSTELNTLLKIQEDYLKKFQQNGLMKLITGQEIANKEIRVRMLDCIQTFSDYFQKAVMLRAIFTEHSPLAKMAQVHLEEEFGHNTALLADRGHRPSCFDPILDSTTAWFCWKMLTLSSLEKTLLMHWVLEASAYVFFTEAHKVMEYYKETEYFRIHAEADEHHKELNLSFLEGLRSEEYGGLSNVLEQGWKVMFTACDSIAKLSLNKT